MVCMVEHEQSLHEYSSGKKLLSILQEASITFPDNRAACSHGQCSLII